MRGVSVDVGVTTRGLGVEGSFWGMVFENPATVRSICSNFDSTSNRISATACSMADILSPSMADKKESSEDILSGSEERVSDRERVESTESESGAEN